MKPFIYLIFLLCVQLSIGQRIKTVRKETLRTNAENFITRDNLGADYFVISAALIKKDGVQQWEYQNISLGKITSVDVINPLKIVVFYQDYNSVVILDNQLNEIQKFDFSQYDSSVVASTVGMAGQNQLWVFNSINQKLMLFDFLKTTFKEMPIPIQGKLKSTESNFNFFYWIDELNQWNSCDIFGKFTTGVTLPAFDEISIIDPNRLIFSINSKLYLLNANYKSVTEIEIVEKSFQHFYYKDQILAIFTQEEIIFYTLKLP